MWDAGIRDAADIRDVRKGLYLLRGFVSRTRWVAYEMPLVWIPGAEIALRMQASGAPLT
jgi:hypothetical protein